MLFMCVLNSVLRLISLYARSHWVAKMSSTTPGMCKGMRRSGKVVQVALLIQAIVYVTILIRVTISFCTYIYVKMCIYVFMFHAM